MEKEILARRWRRISERQRRRSQICPKIWMKIGSDIEARDGKGYTALHQAAGKGHEAVVGLLLEKVPNLDAKSVYRNSARSGSQARIRGCSAAAA